DCHAGSARRRQRPRRKAGYSRSQRALTWIGERTQRIADEIEGEHGQEHRDRRKESEPRRDLQAFTPLTDHAAPARYRRRYTEAEERQGALHHDGNGDAEQEEGKQW